MTDTDAVEIVRVVRVIETDVVSVQRIAAGPDAAIRHVRSQKMALQGADSFWKIGRLKSDPLPKLAPHVPAVEVRSAPLLPTRSVSFTYREATSRPSFGANVPAVIATAKPEPKVYRDVERLNVAIRFDTDTLERLREGTLRSELSRTPDYVEVKKDVWLSSESLRRTSDGLRLADDVALSKAPVLRFRATAEFVRTGTSLVLFPPSIVPNEFDLLDLRTETEIVAAADAALARVAAALDDATGKETLAQVRSTLGRYLNLSSAPDEISDVEAALELLQRRELLVDVIPRLVSVSPVLSASLHDAFELERQERLRRLDDEILARRREAAASLAEIEAALHKASYELQLVGERERAYRDAAADIEGVLNARLEERVGRIVAENSSTLSDLEGDLEALRTELRSSLAADVLYGNLEPFLRPVGTTPGLVTPVVAVSVQNPSARKPLELADRTRVLAEVGSLFGVAADTLAVALAAGRSGRLPVFVGPGGTKLSVDLAAAILPTRTFRIFCDPTLVSVRDILVSTGEVDGRSVVEAVREFALQEPDALVPIVLTGLTRSPCEFWVDSFLDGRDDFGLPSNVVVLASADPERLRTPLPYSILQSIMPVSTAHRPLGIRHPSRLAGDRWPSQVSTGASFVAEVLTAVGSIGHTPDRLAFADGLARAAATLHETTASKVAEPLSALFAWIDAVVERDDHPDLFHFRDFGD